MFSCIPSSSFWNFFGRTEMFQNLTCRLSQVDVWLLYWNRFKMSRRYFDRCLKLPKVFLQSVFSFAGATGKRQLYVAKKTYANCEIVFFSQNQCYRSNLRSICLSFFNFRSRSRLLLYNNTLLNICQYLWLKNPKRFSALSSIYNAFVRFRFRGRHFCLHVFIDLLRRSLETAYLLYGENDALSTLF